MHCAVVAVSSDCAVRACIMRESSSDGGPPSVPVCQRFGYQEYTEELEELHAKKVEERVDMIVDELDLCARAAAKAPTPGEVSLTESPYLNPMLEHVTRLQILTRQLKGHMQEFTASKRDTRNRMLGLEAASEAGVPTPPSTVHARSSRLRGYTQARVGPVLYGGGD
jgi:hypothetical protein